MAVDINEFAKQVEADLVAVNPEWAEYPFGTEDGILEQYGQTFDGVGTIFYYAPQKNADDEWYRNTLLLDMAREDSVPLGDGIDPLPEVFPPEKSDLVYYGIEPPETPALSPIWFDTLTGDIRIWYSYGGNETWVNTGVAGVGKIEFLNDLQDVDTLTIPAVDEDHLQFNIGMNKWLPFDLHGHLSATYAPILHSHTVASLDDVTIDTIEQDHVLVWSGSGWENKSLGSVDVWRGPTPPTNPTKYPIWFNTSSAFTAIYYDDGDSTQWINIGGSDSRVDQNIQANAFLSQIQSGYIEGTGWSKLLFVTSAGSGYDTDSNFNNVTNTYIAPVDGIYDFNCTIRLDNLTNSSYTFLEIRKNDVSYVRKTQSFPYTNTYAEISMTVNVLASEGDEITMWKNENTDVSHTIKQDSWFSGSLKSLV